MSSTRSSNVFAGMNISTVCPPYESLLHFRSTLYFPIHHWLTESISIPINAVK